MRVRDGIEICGRTIAPALLLAMLGAAGDAVADYHLVGASNVYTLVNLHPDEGRTKLNSVNYQQKGMIPLCTKVTIIDAGNSSIKFIADETGREYTYNRYGKLQAPWSQHLDCVFGTRCNRGDATSLGSIDRRGIAEGRIYRGMSKQGVIYAIGYPPDHATPSLTSAAWRYWSSRFNGFIVHFDGDGRVLRVRE